MWGLIYKDILNLKKSFRAYAALVVFYAALSLFEEAASGMMGVAIVLSAILPITAIAYDERAKWDRYVLTMPVSRRNVVLAKYMLGFLMLIPTLLVCFAFQVVSRMPLEENLLLCAVFCGLGVLLLSLVLPIIYRFGAERGRIAMMVVLFVPTVCIGLLAKSGVTLPEPDVLLRVWYWPPIALIVLCAVSMFLSVRIYQKKEF